MTGKLSGRHTTSGKLLLGSAAGLTAAGGYLMDWNRVRLFQPELAACQIPWCLVYFARHLSRRCRIVFFIPEWA